MISPLPNKADMALPIIMDAVDNFIDAILVKPKYGEDRLVQAMRHIALSKGKRLRAALVLATGEMLGASRDKILPAAAAIELIHSYSLVHDDLPAMDDDDMRRGRLTVHKAYDEAHAILAGDALQSLAFEILSDPRYFPHPSISARLIHNIARAIGIAGMAGGQSLDILWENGARSAEDVMLIQRWKTGALITASLNSGVIISGATDRDAMALERYGKGLGLTFQIVDDILDICGEDALIGKQVRKDAARGKQSFVSIHGLEGAKEHANMLIDEAIEALRPFGEGARLLKDLAYFTLRRDR